MEYLGLILKEGRLSMDPTKLNGIRDWPIPKMVKDVRSFPGFGNFYRKFIRGFADLAQPLNELLKKDVKFKWTPEHQTTFDVLKKNDSQKNLS